MAGKEKDRQLKPSTDLSPQQILNWSFDDVTKFLAMIMMGWSGSKPIAISVDSEGKTQIKVADSEGTIIDPAKEGGNLKAMADAIAPGTGWTVGAKTAITATTGSGALGSDSVKTPRGVWVMADPDNTKNVLTGHDANNRKIKMTAGLLLWFPAADLSQVNVAGPDTTEVAVQFFY